MTESATISGTNRRRGSGVKGSTSHQELDEVADEFEEDAVGFVEPVEDEIDDEDSDDEDFDDEDFADASVGFDESDDEDEEEGEDATPKRSRAKKTSDDDDDEEADDDDTEEDLEAILKARLGTQDDDEEEDDEEEENGPRVAASSPRQALVEDGPNFTVHPRQASEWVCAECFLIVNKASAAATTCPHCGADAVNARR